MRMKMTKLKADLNRRRFLIDGTRIAAAWALVPPAFAYAEASSNSQVAETVLNLAPDLKSDPRRPQFHLLPAKNWMNDPNGPIFWKGHYHMFFQYNPHAAVWGDMHWNHAVSADMIHWKHLPIALAPTPGGPDADGCFSGTAVVRDGMATFLYTGVKTAPPEDSTIRDGHNNFRETQLYATSKDSNLLHWTKRAEPVIAKPPPGLEVTGFRDPHSLVSGWRLVHGRRLRRKRQRRSSPALQIPRPPSLGVPAHAHQPRNGQRRCRN